MEENAQLESGPTHRERRADSSPTPPLKGSASRVQRRDRADALASVLMLVSLGLSSGAVLWSSHGVGYARPMGFLWMAGASWLAWIVGLFAVWEQRFRHGLARHLFTLGAAILIASGLLYSGRVSFTWSFLGNWVPAAIALIAALYAGTGQGTHLKWRWT